MQCQHQHRLHGLLALSTGSGVCLQVRLWLWLHTRVCGMQAVVPGVLYSHCLSVCVCVSVCLCVCVCICVCVCLRTLTLCTVMTGRFCLLAAASYAAHRGARLLRPMAWRGMLANRWTPTSLLGPPAWLTDTRSARANVRREHTHQDGS